MKNRNQKEREQKIRRAVKKGLSISLCAVLVGGFSAAAYEGVNAVTGWGTDQVSAASHKVELVQTASEESSAGKGSLDVSSIVE